MQKIKITNKIIGKNHPCFVIAEAGVNHNGNVTLAQKLIDVAKKAGADAIKFQTFTAEYLSTRTAAPAPYQQKNTGKKQTQFQLLKTLELTNKDFIALKKYCDKKNIIFLSTPHTQDRITLLDKLIPAYKIASGDLTNLPLLQNIAKKKKPIILSTGMGTMREIHEAVKTIKKAGNEKIILLHCTTSYPCTLDDVNLRAMLTMQRSTKLLIGYSDHTTDPQIIPIMARTLGAVVIEKHLTLDKSLPGPDHKASLSPEELKQMVKAIHSVDIAMGSNVKAPTKIEKHHKNLMRKSLIAKRQIPKNKIITFKDISIKRPGTGLPPHKINKIIGKKTKVTIKQDALIHEYQLY